MSTFTAYSDTIYCASQMQLDSGHEATFLEGEELAQQQKDFSGYRKGLVRLNPGRWMLAKNFTKVANDIYNFKVIPLRLIYCSYSFS